MDNTRFWAEYAVLSNPGNGVETAFAFYDLDTEPYVEIKVVTNRKNNYTLRIDLSDFPESIPPAFVKEMLRNKDGNALSDCSSSMHTLCSEHGWTRICHYGYSSWTPRVSIYKVFIRCRLWLEAYESHLETGNPIDYYLRHSH